MSININKLHASITIVENFSYEELLKLAHTKSLNNIKLEVVQVPRKDNNDTAICIATAKFENGKSFTSVGEASPKSIDDSSLIRNLTEIASIKAKTYALKDALITGISADTPEFKCSNPSAESKATIRQLSTIEKLSKKLGDTLDPNEISRLNKTKASDLITDLSKRLKNLEDFSKSASN